MSNPTSPLDLGTLPVSKLLKQYAFPAIVAMTASSLYNMVDSIFIGHGVGPLAISGLALTFPFMNLSAAFGAMVGIGASTLISVRLGQQDYKAAQDIFGNVVTLTLILGVLFSIVALVFLDPILSFFGASPATLPYAREYMEIILLGNVVTHSFFTFNAILRSTGHPQLAMNATIMAVVGNTILNPIFIYGHDSGTDRLFVVAGERLSPPQGAHPVQTRHLPPEKENRQRHFRHRHVSLLDEQLRLSCRNPHQPRIRTVRRRPGHRCVWHRQPRLVHLHHDCHRIEPRHAAHRRIQLRFAGLPSCTQSAALYPALGYVDYHDRFSHRGVASRIVRPCFYDRRRTDRHCRERNAYRSHILSFNRHANGYDQLLPEHRASEQEHFPVPDTATAVPHPPASDIASVLGCKRSMVGHAYIRCHRMYSSRNHVNYSIQKI